MRKPQVELLAPASGLEAIRSVVHAGADAVYTGGSRFGARAYANNLNEEELFEAIQFVHLYGKRLYLTVNTLLKEKELVRELIDYLWPYYEKGLDAVIVQDIGVFCAIKERFPELPIHVSTQAVVTGRNSAKMFEDMGASRIVTARELSLEELKTIRAHTNIEIESFIHGALCYCYSGQCLFSSFAGGRSGNRGRCAQPCRLPYELLDEKGNRLNRKDMPYLLSPKDICTLDILPDIIEAGVYSLKIEGRMKRTEYAAGVTEIYRKYIDQYLRNGRRGYTVRSEDREQLMDLYNRGSFHDGYYQLYNGREMMAMERPNHNGTCVGILSRTKRGWLLKPQLSLHRQDVLELRTAGQSLEFVLERDVSCGDGYVLPDSCTAWVREQQSGHGQQAHTDAVEVYRTRNEWLLQEIHKKYVEEAGPLFVKGEAWIEEGREARLTIWMGEYTVSVAGAPVQTAKNQPANAEYIKKQLTKTGNTPFVFQDLQVILKGNCFLSVRELNELRRAGLKELEASVHRVYQRKVPQSALEEADREAGMTELYEEAWKADFRQCCAAVESLEHLEVLLEFPQIDRIDVSIHTFSILSGNWETGFRQLKEARNRCRAAGVGLYLVFPHIWREDMQTKLLPHIDEVFGEIDGVIAKNMEVLSFVNNWLKDSGKRLPIVLDYTAYAMNRQAAGAWKRLGASAITLPVELNKGEITAFAGQCPLPAELMVYGHLPMMVSAQCPVRNTIGCRNETGITRLKDRKGNLHYVKNYCDACYSVIYNSDPLYLLDRMEEVCAVSCAALRLNFTVETKKEVKQVMEQLEGRMDSGRRPTQSGKPCRYTRGHWKRGVE